MTVKIYSLPSDAMSPPVTEGFVTDFVLASDYMELQRKVEELESALSTATESIANAHHVLRVETAKSNQLAVENAGMDKFVNHMLHIAWHGGNADGYDIQDAAIANGLIRQEVYCSDEHETLVEDPGNFEDGDAIYFRVETPATDAAIAEIKAKGIESGIETIMAMMNHQAPGVAEAIRVLRVHAEQLRKESTQ